LLIFITVYTVLLSFIALVYVVRQVACSSECFCGWLVNVWCYMQLAWVSSYQYHIVLSSWRSRILRIDFSVPVLLDASLGSTRATQDDLAVVLERGPSLPPDHMSGMVYHSFTDSSGGQSTRSYLGSEDTTQF